MNVRQIDKSQFDYMIFLEKAQVLSSLQNEKKVGLDEDEEKRIESLLEKMEKIDFYK